VKLDHVVTVVRKAWNRNADPFLGICWFLLSLVLYVQTMAPSVASLFDDSLEMPLVCHRLGIAHPTGYPLYTLLGKLLTFGPWHNVAWSVNLLSAVAGALTVALVYLLIRQVTRRRLPGLLGAVALAVSPVFWSQSVIAEVYTLNSAFVAALLLVAMRWARRPFRPVEPFSLLQVKPGREQALFLPGEGPWMLLPPALRRMAARASGIYRRFFPAVPPKRRLRLDPRAYALVALFGLSLTHHRLAALLAPALLIFALLVERRVLSRAALLGPEHLDRARWLRVAFRPALLLLASLLAPLLLYLYLPLRGHVGSLDGTYDNSWRGFWNWVTAHGYGLFFADNPLARDLDVAFYADLFWRQFGPMGLALMVVGVIGLRRQRKALALTGVAFVTFFAFAVIYRVPDVEVFFIPAFVLAAVWIGVGLDYGFDLLRPRGSSMAVRRLLAGSLLLLCLDAVIQPLAIAIHRYPDVDLSRRWSVHDYGLYLLSQPLPANSMVIGILGEMNLLRYLQETTGLRDDIETVAVDYDPVRRQQVEDALAQGREVYITHPLPELAESYALDAVIGVIRLNDVPGEPQTLIRVGHPEYEVPNVPRAADVVVLPGLRLVGYGVHEHRAHWQAWARLQLWWRAMEGLEEHGRLKVSARLLDASGQTVATVDAEPVSWAYPTTAWRPGEVIADAYEIPLPTGLSPGDYRPLVIVYESATGTERGRLELAPVRLEGSPARPPRRALEASMDEMVYARFGAVELLGLTPPDPEVLYPPGSALPLTLLWQARGRPSGDLRIYLWLEDEEEEHFLGEARVGGGLPAEEWFDGQVVRQWPVLPLASAQTSGTYHLKMRVTRDGQPTPWGRGLLPLGSDMDLGIVRIGQ
jgi:hypothetical protein